VYAFGRSRSHLVKSDIDSSDDSDGVIVLSQTPPTSLGSSSKTAFRKVNLPSASTSMKDMELTDNKKDIHTLASVVALQMPSLVQAAFALVNEVKAMARDIRLGRQRRIPDLPDVKLYNGSLSPVTVDMTQPSPPGSSSAPTTPASSTIAIEMERCIEDRKAAKRKAVKKTQSPMASVQPAKKKKKINLKDETQLKLIGAAPPDEPSVSNV